MKTHVFDILPEEYKPVRVYCNVNISKMAFKYLKKEKCCLWKTELNGIKTQEEHEPEEKIPALNSGENEYNKNDKFF